jgi:uncharacterized protein YcfJ
MKRLTLVVLLVGGGATFNPARADFEEVRILRVEPVQVQSCAPAQQMAQPPQAQPQDNATITGKQLLGGAAGAAVGGVVGHQFGSGSGRTAATVAGAGLGAYAGYKLTESKIQPTPAPASAPAAGEPAQTTCSLVTQHRVEYARSNGLVGHVLMSSQPTGSSLLMSFCGDAPCN